MNSRFYTTGVFIAALVSFSQANAGGPISSSSKAGEKLLSRARQLGDNGFRAYWIGGYSINFSGCMTTPRFDSEEGITSSILAKFKLCKTSRDGSSCGKCDSAGEYIVSMNDFITATAEAYQSSHEYECNAALENCEYSCEYGNNNNGNNNGNNNNGNNGYCMYQCLENAGMTDCYDDQQQDQAFEDLLDCRPLFENGQNVYGKNFFVGATCTDEGVFLGTFTDSSCTESADSGTYEKYMGYSLYSGNLIKSTCISCHESEDGNGNANQYYNYNQYSYEYYDEGSVLDVCGELYVASGKCEVESSVQNYPDTSSCGVFQERQAGAISNSWTSGITIGQAWVIKSLGIISSLLAFTTLVLGCKVMVLSRRPVEVLEDGSRYYRA